MEKLIYCIEDVADTTVAARLLLDELVPALRIAGASNITVNIADLNDRVAETAPARIAGPWQSLAAVVGCWIDCVDDRGGIEQLLDRLGGHSYGYLVTESVVQSCAQTWADGQRRPGVTQFTAHAKPDGVSEAAFYRNWQAHSVLSFDLHPRRWSYVRNAVARALTPQAPPYRSIVLEHFRELGDFVDESRYFGDPAVVRQMYQELGGFCDFERMITGPMSEYRFA